MKGQSSGRSKRPSQNLVINNNAKSGGRRKHRNPSDPQPSSSRPSGSGSLDAELPPVYTELLPVYAEEPQLVGNAGSFFKRPGDEDREPLIEH
ncbi:hypothetical protein QVD99_006400 [Batrachochytrium dendrobatidis]|nr:hypothetical protein QVD99_006400 [Batrachochytrium dendrobatidis]